MINPPFEGTADSPVKAIVTDDDGRFVHNMDLPEPDLIVFIPGTATANDARWSVFAMFAGATRDLRLEHAQIVLRSRSKHITPRHKQMARAIVDGPGDLLLQKGSA